MNMHIAIANLMHATPTPCQPSSVHLASLRPSSPCNGSQLPILHPWLPEIVDNVILEVLLLNSLLGHGVSIWSAQLVPSCPIPSHVSVLVPFALHQFDFSCHILATWTIPASKSCDNNPVFFWNQQKRLLLVVPSKKSGISPACPKHT